MFRKLRTVIYHVDDLQKAKNWYISATGVQPYFDEAFYVGFDINGSELGLDPDMEKIKEGNNSVAFWAVDDIRTAVDVLVTTGGKMMKEIQNVGGGIEVAEIKDPFGNVIGLIQGA
jgi:predicted enzyme related to lactoylglutathione lyase